MSPAVHLQSPVHQAGVGVTFILKEPLVLLGPHRSPGSARREDTPPPPHTREALGAGTQDSTLFKSPAETQIQKMGFGEE